MTEFSFWSFLILLRNEHCTRATLLKHNATIQWRQAFYWFTSREMSSLRGRLWPTATRDTCSMSLMLLLMLSMDWSHSRCPGALSLWQQRRPGCYGVFFSLIELGFSTKSGYCTLQHHKTGESAQMWAILLIHTQSWLSSSCDWLIWEDSVWRAARWAASPAVVPAPAESVTVEVLHCRWSQIRSSVRTRSRRAFSLLMLHQSPGTLSVERDTQ